MNRTEAFTLMKLRCLVIRLLLKAEGIRVQSRLHNLLLPRHRWGEIRRQMDCCLFFLLTPETLRLILAPVKHLWHLLLFAAFVCRLTSVRFCSLTFTVWLVKGINEWFQESWLWLISSTFWLSWRPYSFKHCCGFLACLMSRSGLRSLKYRSRLLLSSVANQL